MNDVRMCRFLGGPLHGQMMISGEIMYWDTVPRCPVFTFSGTLPSYQEPLVMEYKTTRYSRVEYILDSGDRVYFMTASPVGSMDTMIKKLYGEFFD